MKNLKRAKRQFERTAPAEAAKYDFFPTTYLLPNEYNMFVEEFKKQPSGSVWIMKPIGRAQGKGEGGGEEFDKILGQIYRGGGVMDNFFSFGMGRMSVYIFSISISILISYQKKDLFRSEKKKENDSGQIPLEISLQTPKQHKHKKQRHFPVHQT